VSLAAAAAEVAQQRVLPVQVVQVAAALGQIPLGEQRLLALLIPAAAAAVAE
jgi:hypothetical protein